MKPIIVALFMLLAATASGNELVYAFNGGGFDPYTDVEGNLFEADRAYVPGDAGHINGYAQQPPYIPNISPWTSLDFELHYRQNRLLEGYCFDLPAGDYLVRLYFFDGVKHGPQRQVHSFTDADGDDALGLRVVAHLEVLLDVMADGASEGEKTEVGGVGGVPAAQGIDGGVADPPRRHEVRLADAQ